MNYSGIRDKVIDNDLLKASHTTNNKVRQQYYTSLQQRMAKEDYWIQEYYRPKIDTSDGKVAKFSQNPTNVGAEWNSWQWSVKGKS
jgi:ABC-type transport system substrate-binding protein